ncbi:biotin-independent malonate decarboxylase subunit gamma [Advenella mimigardefordensis]|uniref:Putative malonate decarboxylase gamma subunit n=1 Tax=Advenella mimigardefordensis (strain DSM 17166 / LMG 22922 / DPN7) TaxID=1247726 RepID=W0P7R4_ADVMD|nr:biotin-independent malonate decarboxylase subunit gamma [Advenella mimigardefordensis]AHG62894.1 putative malonate decarboxylase gamma subunit [Advenella mimigardefordensis DPN7]
MNLPTILDALFPTGHQISINGHVLAGTANTASGSVAVLGTTDAAAIDHEIALFLAQHILATIQAHPRRPVIFLVDTQGQALSRAEELLCLNGSLAHLAACVDLARRLGHVSLSLVTGEAVSGGYLSFGLMADRAYALASAQVRVMDLKAMARVTKIDHAKLQELAVSAPTFAPGADNYQRMGAIEEIWPTPSASLLDSALAALLKAPGSSDRRMQAAQDRTGRLEAARIVDQILAA